jgi:hypothetical protein
MARLPKFDSIVALVSLSDAVCAGAMCSELAR